MPETFMLLCISLSTTNTKIGPFYGYYSAIKNKTKYVFTDYGDWANCVIMILIAKIMVIDYTSIGKIELKNLVVVYFVIANSLDRLTIY